MPIQEAGKEFIVAVSPHPSGTVLQINLQQCTTDAVLLVQHVQGRREERLPSAMLASPMWWVSEEEREAIFLSMPHQPFTSSKDCQGLGTMLGEGGTTDPLATFPCLHTSGHTPCSFSPGHWQFPSYHFGCNYMVSL